MTLPRDAAQPRYVRVPLRILPRKVLQEMLLERGSVAGVDTGLSQLLDDIHDDRAASGLPWERIRPSVARAAIVTPPSAAETSTAGAGTQNQREVPSPCFAPLPPPFQRSPV